MYHEQLFAAEVMKYLTASRGVASPAVAAATASAQPEGAASEPSPPASALPTRH